MNPEARASRTNDDDTRKVENVLTALQLKECHLLNLCLELSKQGRVFNLPEAKAPNGPYGISFGLHWVPMGISEDFLTWGQTMFIKMRATSKKKPTRFSKVEVEVAARFTLPLGIDEETLDSVGDQIPKNCIMMIYGAIRSFVLSSTATMNGRPFVIPSIDVSKIQGMDNYFQDVTEFIRACERGEMKADPNDEGVDLDT